LSNASKKVSSYDITPGTTLYLAITPDELDIHIMLPSKKVLTLICLREETIEDIKLKIEQKEGVPVECQVLPFDNDKMTIREANIRTGMKLPLLLDSLSQTQPEQIQLMIIHLQRECSRIVHLQQLTLRDQRIFHLQQELEKPEDHHVDVTTSTATQDNLSLEEVEEELKCVKEEFHHERQSFEQRLAAETECTHRAERDREIARQEVEQARDEVKRITMARDKELEDITEENQQLQITLATERSMFDEAKHNEKKMRDHASEQERLLLESQSQQQGLQNGLQYLRTKNEELRSELNDQARAHTAELERMRLECQTHQQRFETENQALQQRLETALADVERLSQSASPPANIDAWNVSRSDVRVSREIGRGGWGVVMQGTYSDKTVAVKLPHQDLLNERLLERLKRETRLMIQVQHPNLIRIIAAVFDEAANRLRLPPMIITELLDINLRSCYQQERLQDSNRMQIFLDVAYGLHYLHDRQEPIIHRDVSAPNVLLKALSNGMWRAKVSDFGSANLARLSVTAGDGAIIYSPPEVFPQTDPNKPRIPHTTKIDVYSFGILMCEVVTAEQPDPEHYLDHLEQVRQLFPLLYSLIVCCTNQNPNKRPTMAAVIDELNKISSP
jgi:ubiquitin thioesterase CYLD